MKEPNSNRKKQLHAASHVQAGIAQHPAFVRFRTALGDESSLSFTELHDYLDELTRGDFISHFLGCHLDGVVTSNYYQLGEFADAGGFYLIPVYLGKTFTLSLTLVNGAAYREAREKASGGIVAPVSERDTLIYCLRDGGSRQSLYRTNKIFDDGASLAPDIRLEKVRDISLKPREHLYLEGGRDTIVVDHVEDYYCQLTAISHKRAPSLIPHFQLESGRLLGASAGNKESSFLENMMLLLGELKHREAVPALERLTQHSDYFVRWSAIRQIIGLDRDKGCHYVSQARSDRHEEVRKVAHQTQEILQFNEGT